MSLGYGKAGIVVQCQYPGCRNPGVMSCQFCGELVCGKHGDINPYAATATCVQCARAQARAEQKPNQMMNAGCGMAVLAALLLVGAISMAYQSHFGGLTDAGQAIETVCGWGAFIAFIVASGFWIASSNAGKQADAHWRRERNAR